MQGANHAFQDLLTCEWVAVGCPYEISILIIEHYYRMVFETVTQPLDKDNAGAMVDKDGEEVVKLGLASTVDQVYPVGTRQIFGFISAP